MKRWPFFLFGAPWIFSAVYFGIVAALARSHIVRDPNLTANYWIFGMVVVCVASVISGLHIERDIVGIKRLGLMLAVVVNLIVATGVAAGVGFTLAADLFEMH